MYSTSIFATVWCDILVILSSLAPGGTWTEAAHDWVFLVEPVGLKGGRLVFTNMSLMTFQDDTSIKMEFM